MLFLEILFILQTVDIAANIETADKDTISDHVAVVATDTIAARFANTNTSEQCLRRYCCYCY